MVGLGDGLAEKPEYVTAAVSTLGECCCVKDTGGSYGVDRQRERRFDKVHKKTFELEVFDKRYSPSINSNSITFNGHLLHFPDSLLLKGVC